MKNLLSSKEKTSSVAARKFRFFGELNVSAFAALSLFPTRTQRVLEEPIQVATKFFLGYLILSERFEFGVFRCFAASWNSAWDARNWKPQDSAKRVFSSQGND